MNSSKKDYLFTIYRLIANYHPFSENVCAFIAAQFSLESDFGTSRLAIDYNNHCGMRRPLVRPTLSSSYSELQQFAKYDSVDECVADYVLALTYHRPLRCQLEDLGLFRSFIKKWYCPERDYIARVDAIYNQFFNLLNSNYNE